jgi:hypothetical protein
MQSKPSKHPPQDDKDEKHRLILIRHRRDCSISLEPIIPALIGSGIGYVGPMIAHPRYEAQC